MWIKILLNLRKGSTNKLFLYSVRFKEIDYLLIYTLHKFILCLSKIDY